MYFAADSKCQVKNHPTKNVLMTYSHDNVSGCKLRIRGIQADAVLVMLGSLAVRVLILTIRSDSQSKRAISCRNCESVGGKQISKGLVRISIICPSG